MWFNMGNVIQMNENQCNYCRVDENKKKKENGVNERKNNKAIYSDGSFSIWLWVTQYNILYRKLK